MGHGTAIGGGRGTGGLYAPVSPAAPRVGGPLAADDRYGAEACVPNSRPRTIFPTRDGSVRSHVPRRPALPRSPNEVQ